MREAVDARSGTIVRAPQTNLAGQAPEETVNVLVQQSTASLRDEEVWAATGSEMRIAWFGVAAERCAGRRMQRTRRDLPSLVNRTVSTPASRSTLSRWRPIASDRRIPVTAINPNR